VRREAAAGNLISCHRVAEDGCYPAMLGHEAARRVESEVIVFTKRQSHVHVRSVAHFVGDWDHSFPIQGVEGGFYDAASLCCNAAFYA
jgi:hypothetical protein